MRKEKFIEICKSFGFFYYFQEGPYGCLNVYFAKPYFRDFQVASYISEEMINVYTECYVSFHGIDGKCIKTSTSTAWIETEEKLIEALNEFKLSYKNATQNLRKMELEKDFQDVTRKT